MIYAFGLRTGGPPCCSGTLRLCGGAKAETTRPFEVLPSCPAGRSLSSWTRLATTPVTASPDGHRPSLARALLTSTTPAFNGQDALPHTRDGLAVSTQARQVPLPGRGRRVGSLHHARRFGSAPPQLAPSAMLALGVRAEVVSRKPLTLSKLESVNLRR
ncbi:hypothetical protein CDD83_2774 [Cordyceps sp. RAO-2017]|nr:hypothetical protein CDD83_2774 [Cordyceps sp. RAO-2017]